MLKRVKVFPLIQKELRDAGIGYGFQEQEIAGLTDARYVQVLWDALQYRKSKANVEGATKKAAKARPVTKPKAKAVQDPDKKRREKQAQRFKQSGRIEDAVDLIFKS